MRNRKIETGFRWLPCWQRYNQRAHLQDCGFAQQRNPVCTAIGEHSESADARLVLSQHTRALLSFLRVSHCKISLFLSEIIVTTLSLPFQLRNDYINLMKVLIFFAVVQTLLILFSYFGTKLMEEVSQWLLIWFVDNLKTMQSEAVGDAIYDLPWYQISDFRTRRYLLLVMIRAQRPCTITAFKFYSVNLESYCNALTTAFSYCTVLQEVM